MFTVEIHDNTRGLEDTVNFNTEADTVEFVNMYEDTECDILMFISDDENNFYCVENNQLVPYPEEPEDDYLECGFDPYEGCYTYDC